MDIIKCVVRGQKLSVNIPFMADNTINYFNVMCDFDSTWNIYTQRWVYITKHDDSSVGGSFLLNSENKVPDTSSLNLNGGTWDIWLLGAEVRNGSVISRITTEVKSFRVNETGNYEAVMPSVPTSNVEQITQLAKDAMSNSEYARVTADEAKEIAENVKEMADNGELDGATFTPSVSSTGVISWTNNKELPNPQSVNIMGPQGPQGPQGVQGPQGIQGVKGDKGDSGATFTPDVSEAGVISWTNNKGLPNPESVNIMGPQGPQGVQGPQGPKGDTGEVSQEEFDALSDEVADQKSALETEYLGMKKVTVTASTATGDYADLNTFPKNTIVIVAQSAVPVVANYPKGYNQGATVITLNGYSANSGTVQFAFFFNDLWAMRICVSNAWKDWQYKDVYTRTFRVRADGTGDFGSVVSAIKNTMDSGYASYFYRYIIDIGEGTFDLSAVSDMVIGGKIDRRGLFVMPYVTIRGKGKDKTKLTYYYNGTNDAVMSTVSGLNMPYESALEDLTVSVKNIRYAVHSDNALASEQSDFTNTNLNDNKIRLKNVSLEHLGFDSELTPTYKVPTAWGGGTWDATDREFTNCDFISKEVCGFLTHNRVGITKPSNIVFTGCNFITYNSDIRVGSTAAYCSCALISWGSGIKTNVSFQNCMVNKFVALTVATNYNADAVIDYIVKADNKLFIIESTTNNAHLNDNFRTSGCIESICASSGGIVAYTPVSKNRLYWVHGYVSTEAVKGIALCSAAQNEPCIIQTSGFVAIPMLTAKSFSDGDYIGYSNGDWVVDETNPIIRVIGGNVGVLLQN